MAVCPNCGEDNPERARLCMMCGTALAEAPREQAEERKVVSVLFVDLVGFTARSHDADPEDVRAALAPYHRLLKIEIERFGGTVEKFIGDAVMAVFGAPVAHEDDAERAVRAALRITEAIEELNQATPHLDLSIRAAVNTGEGLVTLGANRQGEGMVTGDVVNTASRLQGIAPVGGVAVGEVTYRSTKDLISYEPLDPVEGKPESMPVWRAVSARSRFGVDVDMAPKTPFIGRDFDLAVLENAYQRSVREASVQLVTVTGEPGVGKTRLLAEFTSFIDEQDELVLWRQGRSLPYGEGITFWALGEIVKAEAGILESDGPETASDKLQGAVEAVVETNERAWFVARLGPLVGAKSSQSGSAEKEESFTAWRRFLEAIASRGPLVVVFEDVHWADAAMLEFIDHLVEWSTGVPLLVVCTARPELYERHQGWGGGKRNSNSISLSPLSDSETAQLISGLLFQAVLPAEVHADLLERAGGNPLYAEEFIRMLSDQGILQRRGRVLTIDSNADILTPDNVHALIAARLDTLPAERKALLHDASVAGKVFWSGAVAALVGRGDQEVREGLHELARKELVRPIRNSSIKGQQENSFWHALIRDVAYGQIPRAAKGAKHQAMAEWIERIAGDRVADQAELLAHHFGQALELAGAAGASLDRDDLKARTGDALVLAGDRAMGLDATRAEIHYRRALELLHESHSTRSLVVKKRAQAAFQAGLLEEAEEAYGEAIRGFREQLRPIEAGDALLGLSDVLWYQGKVRQCREVLFEAVESLESQSPGPELASAYTEMALDCVLSGHSGEASEWADKALKLAEELELREQLVEARGYRGFARCTLGDLGGLEEQREALRRALELELGRSAALIYAQMAEIAWSVQDPASGLDLYRSGVDYTEQRGMSGSAMFIRSAMLGSLFDLGRWDEVLVTADRVVDWSKGHGAVYLAVSSEIWKLRVLSHRAEVSGRARFVTTLPQRAREIGDPSIVVGAYAAATTAHTYANEFSSALPLVRELVEMMLAERSGWDWYRGQHVAELVRVCTAGGDLRLAQRLMDNVGLDSERHRCGLRAARAAATEAKGEIDQARDLYEEAARGWGNYGFVLEEGQAHLGLARCLIALGEHGAATEPLQKARAIFSRLGALPLINETDTYLEQQKRHPRSALLE